MGNLSVANIQMLSPEIPICCQVYLCLCRSSGTLNSKQPNSGDMAVWHDLPTELVAEIATWIERQKATGLYSEHQNDLCSLSPYRAIFAKLLNHIFITIRES